MEVKPKVGVASFKFGMLRDQVIKYLGSPDKTITDEYDPQEMRLVWNRFHLTMTFQADGRFTYFSSRHPELTYLNQYLINVPIKEAKENIFGRLITDWEVEDYDSFETHFNEKLWLTLYTKYGKVIEFELGVPFKNETEYEWPE